MLSKACLTALCLLCLAGSLAGAAPGVVVVAHDPTSPPMEFLERGNLVGYSVDYIDTVAREAGFRVEHKIVDWDGSFGDLAGKRYDVLASSVTITSARQKLVSFSTPYYEVHQVLLTRKEDAFSSLSGMKGKNVGTTLGTTGYVTIKSVPGVKVLMFDSYSLAISSLFLDRIDGVVCDDIVAAYFLSHNKDYAENLKVAFVIPSDTPNYYGFAVNQGNKELLNLLNKGIAAVKAKGLEKALDKKWITP